MILVRDENTDELVLFRNVEAILRNINRDRSEDFRPYTKHDWKDGLNMTEFTLIDAKANFRNGELNLGDYLCQKDLKEL